MILTPFVKMAALFDTAVFQKQKCRGLLEDRNSLNIMSKEYQALYSPPNKVKVH